MKVYNFEEADKVVRGAWGLAIKHLQDALGDQFDYRSMKHAWGKFQDYAHQDIEYKVICPKCGEVDGEGNFMSHRLYEGGKKEVCYSCYEDLEVE